jgi:uncharacterized membrane protein
MAIPFSLTLMAPSWCLGSALKIIPLIARLSGILKNLPKKSLPRSPRWH